ncbi:MAG: flippase-like domain-containing protein [bacterium]|nr:flippase-like domain-containing protein [bacterium]
MSFFKPVFNRLGFSTKDFLVFLAKLIVSSALMYFVFSRLPFAEIKKVVQNPNWGILGGAFVVYAISAVGGAMQWSWILKTAGIETPAAEMRRLYFVGLFFNNFLPANIGGDAYKIVDLGRKENRALGVFCSTFLDRLIGLTALTSLAVVFLVLASMQGIALPKAALLLIPATVALVALLAILLSNRLGQMVPEFFNGRGWVKPGRWLHDVSSELVQFRPRVKWLNMIFLFSVGIQFLRIATHIIVALGLGLALGWEQMVQLMVLVPMIALSLILPITINGIGLRESVSAQLLVFSGLATSEVVAMEDVAYLIQVIFSLLGGVLLLAGQRNRSRAGSDDSGK